MKPINRSISDTRREVMFKRMRYSVAYQIWECVANVLRRTTPHGLTPYSLRTEGSTARYPTQEERLVKPIDLPIKAARTECALHAVRSKVTKSVWSRIAKGIWKVVVIRLSEFGWLHRALSDTQRKRGG